MKPTKTNLFILFALPNEYTMTPNLRVPEMTSKQLVNCQMKLSTSVKMSFLFLHHLNLKATH